MKSFISNIAFTFLTLSASALEPVIPDLKSAAEGDSWSRLSPLNITWKEEVAGKPALHIVASKMMDSLLQVPRLEMMNGEIEFDLLGGNEPMKNFIGIAWHVAGANDYEAVYFRTGFFSDEAKSPQSVQYVSVPEWPWNKLRKQKPAQYEGKASPAPDPTRWFHVKIAIFGEDVTVWLDRAAEPTMKVKKLANRQGKGVALLSGPFLGGHFANLKITPASE